MRLEHSFTVPVPVDVAWKVLLDVPRIAPCMPGATLTGVEGDTFTGTVKVKLGPIALSYRGKGRFVERDEAAHRVVIEASGKDTRSAGTAAATVAAVLAADGDATRVDVTTDLSVTGKPAQFGRGMIADVSAKLIGQFADCVATTLAAGSEPPAASEFVAAEAAQDAGPVGPVAATGSDSGPVAAAQPAPATIPAEAEPIDLLKLTGSTATARRLAGYGLGAVLLAVLIWLVVRRLRR
jgi:carbon monoxide dehydrogenase subunit G